METVAFWIFLAVVVTMVIWKKNNKEEVGTSKYVENLERWPEKIEEKKKNLKDLK